MNIGYGQMDMQDNLNLHDHFFLLCWLHKALNIKHRWNLFETGHGKGEHDGVGASVKKILQRWKIIHSSMWFHLTMDVVKWCKLHIINDYNQQSEDVCRYVHNLFISINR